MTAAATIDLALRGAVTETVIELFRERTFDWREPHCINLARAQGIAMGYDLPPVPRFETAQGARRALKKMGVNSVAELLDLWFERHSAPAFARIGDLLLLPGETELGLRDDALAGVGIADGLGNIFGWHSSDPTKLSAVTAAQAHFVAAWKL